MLPGRKEASEEFIVIRVDKSPSEAGRNPLPESFEPLYSAVTDHGSQNLAAAARDGNPEPKVVFPGNTEFIDLDSAMASIERRSSRARTMAASFSVLRWRGLGEGVKIRLHAFHLHLAVPPRL